MLLLRPLPHEQCGRTHHSSSDSHSRRRAVTVHIDVRGVRDRWRRGRLRVAHDDVLRIGGSREGDDREGGDKRKEAGHNVV
jgi:hypothetical protein